MFKKIFLLSLVLIIIASAAFFRFAYPVIKERYFDNSDGNLIIELDSEFENEESGNDQEDSLVDEFSTSTDSSTEYELSIEEMIEQEEEKNKQPQTQPGFITVTREHCANECEDFSDEDEETYCKEICGLNYVVSEDDEDEDEDEDEDSSDSNDESDENSDEDENENCEEKSGLEQDYCYKALAVEKLDFSICNNIQDAGILGACQNRITEDLFEKRSL